MPDPLYGDGSPPNPVLFASDLERSRAFYDDIPGLTVRHDADFLTVRLPTCVLTVLPTLDDGLLSGIAAVLPVTNILDVHRALFRRGMVPWGALELNGVGLMQFAVSDPDGNVLYFMERQTEPDCR